jgi:hypothetical protein
MHRIVQDTNPPFYYSALFWTRRMITDERVAVTILNLASLAATLFATAIVSRRAGVLGWALAAGATFLLSGPVLRYAPEARAYLMGLAVAYAAAWFCALTIEVPDRCPQSLSFTLIGLIAASIHLYAALICGCLAAGLVGMSMLAKRKELLSPGFALGLSASAITALWLPFALRSVDRVRWTQLSFESLVNAYWEVRMLALGSRPAFVLLVILFVVGLMVPATRRLTGAFGLAFAFFLLLPILASFKKPIIGARYWLIGAPCVVVFASFMTMTLFLLGDRARARLYWVGALVGLSFLALLSVNGYFVASSDIEAKENWSGAAIVAPLLQGCPSGSVHVYTSWGFVSGFAFLSHAPEGLFASADAPGTGWIDAKDSGCPVLGWAEHVAYLGNQRLADDFVLTASEDELLQLLKIRSPSSEVDIYRHKGGFVVLRRGTQGSR